MSLILLLISINATRKKKPEIIKKKIAIRSSSSREDGINNSNAGMFKSFLNIIPNNSKMLSFYINQVILSYKKKGGKNDEILIQEMVDDVSISGVATSCKLYSPYLPFTPALISKSDDILYTTSPFIKLSDSLLFLEKYVCCASSLLLYTSVIQSVVFFPTDSKE